MKDKRERWFELTEFAADEKDLEKYTDPVREIDGLICGKDRSISPSANTIQAF